MAEDLMTGRCKFCFYAVNLVRCKPEKMINLSGNCPEWRLRKMTDLEKAKEATVMKAAYARDRAKKGKK